MGIIIKNSIKTTIINYIGVIIGTFSVLFIQTKVLTEFEIGEIRLVLDKALLVLPLILIGMESVASRYYFHFEKDKISENRFITMLTSIPLLILFIFIFIFNIFDLGLNIPNIKAVIIIIFSYMYLYIFEGYLNTKAKIYYPSILRNIVFRLLYLTILALYFYNIIDFNTVINFYALTHLIHLILLTLYLRKNLAFKFSVDFSFWRHPMFGKIMTFCLFLILGSGSAALVSKLDTIMLESITNNRGFVGIYTIALSIATFIELPKRPVAQIVAPMLAKDLSNKKLDKVSLIYKKSALNLMIIAGVLFSLIWINIDFIFYLIPNGEIYSTGKYVVFFLGLAKLFDLSLGVNAEIIHNSKYYKWNLILMPFLAIVTISLNYFLISYYQNALGAAIGTFIAFVFFNIFRTILVQWKLGLQPFSKTYFKVVPFIFIPFILDYLLLEGFVNVWGKMILDSLFVFLFFCLPIYVLKISPDINKLVDGFARKVFN